MCTDFELWKQSKLIFSRPGKAQRLLIKRDVYFGRYTVWPETLLLPGIEIKWPAAINEYIPVGQIVVVNKRNTLSRIDEDIIQHAVSLAGR